MLYRKVYLKAGKEESLKRFHPWVFSGAIAKIEGEPEEGETEEVLPEEEKPEICDKHKEHKGHKGDKPGKGEKPDRKSVV